MKKTEQTKPPSEEYQRFEKLAKALIAVPKSEIDKRQAEYEHERKGRQEKESGLSEIAPPGQLQTLGG